MSSIYILWGQLGVISMDCELVDPDNLLKELQILKSANVDGVMVDCWWGIVERHAPQQYNWSGYKSLFQIVRDLDLKLQVSSTAPVLLPVAFFSILFDLWYTDCCLS